MKIHFFHLYHVSAQLPSMDDVPKFGTKVSSASLLCCKHPRAGIMASDRPKGTAVVSMKHLQSCSVLYPIFMFHL